MTISRITIGLLAATLTLSACAKPGDRVLFDGKYYPAKVKKDKTTRENFVVTVQRAAQGIDGAREAGRYEGTNYCIKNFGDSTIEWAEGQGPEDATPATGAGNLVLRGSCVKW